jgi:hypothetical protein
VFSGKEYQEVPQRNSFGLLFANGFWRISMPDDGKIYRRLAPRVTICIFLVDNGFN